MCLRESRHTEFICQGWHIGAGWGVAFRSHEVKFGTEALAIYRGCPTTLARERLLSNWESSLCPAPSLHFSDVLAIIKNLDQASSTSVIINGTRTGSEQVAALHMYDSSQLPCSEVPGKPRRAKRQLPGHIAAGAETGGISLLAEMLHIIVVGGSDWPASYSYPRVTSSYEARVLLTQGQCPHSITLLFQPHSLTPLLTCAQNTDLL